MNTTPDQRLARAFVALADTLVVGFDVVDFLAVLTERSVELLEVDAAGVILSDQRGGWRPAAGSSERAELIELLAVHARQGPCFDCVASGRPVRSGDLGTETALRKWPRFAPAALEAGFHAASAVPMRLREQTIGALTLLNQAPAGPDDNAIEVGQALADVATIGILHHRAAARAELLAEELEATLRRRAVIEQAKGVLAEHAGIDMHEAFTALRRYAHGRERRLSDAARDLAEGTVSPADVFARG